MIRKNVRTGLLALLMLAIPLQGFAAAAMLACGARHVAMMAAQAPAQPGAMSAEHCEQSGAPASGVPMKCDACSACSALSAAQITAAVATPAVQEVARERIAFVLPLPVGCVPDGLEKPPRSFLA